MGIVPDDKDWTWVLSQRCPDCGFVAAEVTPPEVAGSLPQLLPRWDAVLRRPGATQRPDDSTWSALEYGCHVRDVFGVFDRRLQLMLAAEDPLFDNWDQDQAALDGNYASADPATVRAELLAAGAEVAASFAAVSKEQWERSGRRSNGSLFTVHTLAGYFLHDVVHHLHDVDG